MRAVLLFIVFVGASLVLADHYDSNPGQWWHTPGLARPKRVAKGRYQQALHVEKGDGFMSLNYDAQHVDELKSLMDLANLEDVECTPQGLVLKFSTSSFDRDFIHPGDLVSGGPDFSCSDHDSDIASILHRVSSVHVDSFKRQISLVSSKVPLSEAFHSVDINFNTNNFPDKHHESFAFTPLESKSSSVANHERVDLCEISNHSKRKGGFFSSGFRHALKKLGSFGAKFKERVARFGLKSLEKALHVDKDTHTISLDSDYLTFNYDPTTQSAKSRLHLNGSDAIVCKDCYAATKVGIKFQLQINNKELTGATFEAYGNYTSKLLVSASSTSSHVNSTSPVYSLYAKPLTFMIGRIPIKLNISFLSSFSVDAFIKSSNEIHYGAYSKGDIEFGVNFDVSRGWKTRKFYRPVVSGGIEKAPAHADAHVEFSMSPTLILKMEHIGYIAFGMQDTAELHIAENPDDAKCHLSASSIWGTKFNADFDIDLRFCNRSIFFMDKALIPTQYYRSNLGSGCLDNITLNENGVLLPQPTSLTGAMWTGTLELLRRYDVNYNRMKSCWNILQAKLSVQLLDNPSPLEYSAVMTINIIKNDGSVCVQQQVYIGSNKNSTEVDWIPTADEMNYNHCEGEKALFPVLSWTGHPNESGESWDVSDNNSCYKISASSKPVKFIPRSEFLLPTNLKTAAPIALDSLPHNALQDIQ